MDRLTLERLFRDERIDPNAYSMNGEPGSEMYALDRRGSCWVVYYAERGLENEAEQFDTEDAGCQHLMSLVLRDATTRLTE